MRKQIPILITLIFLSLGGVWSKQPRMPRLLDAGNPSHYHQLVGASIIPELFKGCLLLDSGAPKYLESKPERIYLRQAYIVPYYFSHYEVSYRMNVAITIDSDTIMGITELSATWGNYTQRIAKFENNPVVKKFLQVVKPSAMNFNGTQFYSDGSTLSRAGFNIDTGNFYFLLFKHSELIQSINVFLPKLDSLAWFREFQSKCGIGRLYLENDKLRISQSRDCPTCINNVLFHYSTSRFLEINVGTNQSWEHFPMVQFVLQAVEDRLVGNTLESCKVGSGRNHVYLELDRYIADDNWYVRVAINCRESPKHRDLCFRIKADSTIDRFRVCFQS